MLLRELVNNGRIIGRVIGSTCVIGWSIIDRLNRLLINWHICCWIHRMIVVMVQVIVLLLVHIVLIHWRLLKTILRHLVAMNLYLGLICMKVISLNSLVAIIGLHALINHLWFRLEFLSRLYYRSSNFWLLIINIDYWSFWRNLRYFQCCLFHHRFRLCLLRFFNQRWLPYLLVSSLLRFEYQSLRSKWVFYSGFW